MGSVAEESGEVCLRNVPSSSGDEDDLSEEASDTNIQRNPPKWFLYVIMLLAILLYGSIGVLFRLVKGPSALTKVLWQATMIFILLQLPFIVTFCSTIVTSPEVVIDIFFTSRTLFMIIMTGLTFGFGLVTWYWAVEHTSISHACLLHETHPLILTVLLNMAAVWKPCLPSRIDASLWKKPALRQNVGAFVGFSCIFLMSIHSSGSEVTHKGDVVAFAGAFGMVAFFLLSPQLSRNLPVALYLPWVYFVVCFLVAGACLYYDRPYMWTFNKSGWHQKSWWKNLIIFYQDSEQIAQIFCSSLFSCVAISIISFMSQFFSPQTMSVCLLAEPVVATFFGVAVHVAPAPGLMTYICGLGIVVAILVTITAEKPAPAPQLVQTRKRFPAMRTKFTVPSQLRLGRVDDSELTGLLGDDGYRSDSPANSPEGVFNQLGNFVTMGDHLLSVTPQRRSADMSDAIARLPALVTLEGEHIHNNARPRLKRSLSVDTIHISRIASTLTREAKDSVV